MPRIDQLAAGGQVQTTDLIPIARQTGVDAAGNAQFTDYAAQFTGGGAIQPAAPSIGRNYLLNPRLGVTQRGFGPWVASGYTADRWLAVNSGGGSRSVSLPLLTDADRTAFGDENGYACLQYTFSGDPGINGYDRLTQRLEAVRRLSGKTLALSFWARCIGPSFSVSPCLAQYFGSGGTPSPLVDGVGAIAVALTPTWQRFSLVTPMRSAAAMTFGTNADNYSTFGIFLSAGAGLAAAAAGIGVQSGTAQFWGFQLEVGNAPTALEASDATRDLALCQRFFQIGQLTTSGYQTAGTGFGVTVPPVATMRTTPTVTIVNNATANLSGLAVAPYGNTINGLVYCSGTAIANGTTVINVGYSLSADN